MNLKRIFIFLVRIPANLAILHVRFYQVFISPLLGKNCIYQPTCSAYFIQAVNKYGLIRGGTKGVIRIMRCHPWGRGGIDPP